MIESPQIRRGKHRPSANPTSFASALRAFTLLEVLMGLSLLTMGILGILWLYPWTLRANQTAELRTAAGGLAMMKVEELRRDDTVTSVSLTDTLLTVDTPTTPLVWPLDERLAYSFASDVVTISSGTETTSQTVAKVIVYDATDLDTTLTELFFQ